MSHAPSPHLRSSASSAGNPVSAPRKPSGVPWLGDIPAHWEVKAAKHAYEIQLGKMLQPDSGSGSDEELPYLKSLHVQWEAVRVDDLPTMWASPRDEQKYGVRDGDLLVCEGGDVGRAGILRNVPPRTIIQNALHRVRPLGENDNRMLMYVLRHATGQDWFGIICNRSTIAHFTGEKFGALPIPLPPPAEQRAIADFLDARTGQIDRLVERKRTLIERLREKRSALISRCVTRGLTPAVPLRPSGIPWLGDLPAHWEVKQGRYIGTLLGSESPDEANFTDDESASDSVAYAKVDDLNRLSEELELTATKARIIGCKAINGPFILFPKRGAAIFTNKVAIAKMDLLFDPNLMGWRIYPEFYPKFIAYCLISRRLDDLADTSTIPQINNKHIYPASFPAPPLAEQTAIAAHLDRETGKIDRLITRVETAISRLLEYRSALITAAVTGKIKISPNA